MALVQAIVDASYYLASSDRYKSIKKFTSSFLEEEHSLKKIYFDYFMIFLVVSSVMILILEIKHDLPSWVYFYESLTIFIFILEWLARFWISSDMHLDIIYRYEKAEYYSNRLNLRELISPSLHKKLLFILSPMSIIDLLAILPSYRPLRVLRFLLLFRLFKIFRYTQNMNFLMRVFVEKKFEFLTLLVLFSFIVFFASTVIYLFEGIGDVNENINSFYDALYWAVVTITTVGFGDISPQTHEGRFVTIFLIIGGIAIISFMTSIITTAMTGKIEEIKSNHVINEISKLKEFILVCGYGKMGRALCLELKLLNSKIVVIDDDPDLVKMAEIDGLFSFCGDASDIEVLKKLGVDKKATIVVSLTNSDVSNVSIILSIKTLNSNIQIYTRTIERSSQKKLKIAGADKIIFPYNSAATRGVLSLEQSVAFHAVETIMDEYLDPVIEELEVYSQMRICNTTMQRVGLKKYNLKIFGVMRKVEKNRFYFHPNSDFVVKEKDIIILIGAREDIVNFKLSIHKAYKK